MHQHDADAIARHRIAGIEFQSLVKFRQRFVKQADMQVNLAKLLMRFVQIRILNQSAAICGNRLLVRKSVGGHPQQKTANLVRFR